MFLSWLHDALRRWWTHKVATGSAQRSWTWGLKWFQQWHSGGRTTLWSITCHRGTTGGRLMGTATQTSPSDTSVRRNHKNTQQLTFANGHRLTVPGGLITWSQQWVHAPSLKKKRWIYHQADGGEQIVRPSVCLAFVSVSCSNQQEVKVTVRGLNIWIGYWCCVWQWGVGLLLSIFGHVEGKLHWGSACRAPPQSSEPKLCLPAERGATVKQVNHRREFCWANGALNTFCKFLHLSDEGRTKSFDFCLRNLGLRLYCGI